MVARHPLPLPDYQRIYQVAYSVLEASGIAKTNKSCLFFASFGALILNEVYRRKASISVGCMAIMVDEPKANVVLYGREEAGEYGSDEHGFHAWVESEGWMIDFMAPIMGDGLRADGRDWQIPRRMLQKRLIEGKPDPRALQHLGDFYVRHDRSFAMELLDFQSDLFGDLINTGNAWFRRPPKPLPTNMGMADSHGSTRKLISCAPRIDGIW